MKFKEFLKIYGQMALIEAETFPLYSKTPEQLRSQVSRWIQKGWIISLKRGLYVFSDVYRQTSVSSLYFANRLVTPSYVSMEYALGFYDLVPEKVVMLTSVTTKKTVKFTNTFGTFKYYSIKRKLFSGYTRMNEEGQNVFMASPEKALLDYLYFNQSKFKGEYDEFESMRFQNLEQLNCQTLQEYTPMYGAKMRNIINCFIHYMEDMAREYKNL